jgi:hypothetical protein
MMPSFDRRLSKMLVVAMGLALAPMARGQDPAPPEPTPTPAPAPSPEVSPVPSTDTSPAPSPDASDADLRRRSLEGSIIIDFPSAVANPDKSLQFLVNHRFRGSVQGSDIHSFYSFFSAANVGLGLSYVPVHNLEAGFLRSQELEDYEVFTKYTFPELVPGVLAAAARIGGDFRTERTPLLEQRESFFAQVIVSTTIASRVRVSLVPTFSTWAVGSVPPFQKNVLNLLGALSISVTPTFIVHGEIVPRAYGAAGTGWIASIEKTLLRHRFSFTVGNLRGTTVDQYVIWQPVLTGTGPSPVSDVYFGFNIIRLWKLK